MGNSRAVLLLLVAGCWRTTPQDSISGADTPKSEPGLFTMMAASVGPVGARTPATLQALRDVFVGYDVRPVNGSTLEYDVFAKGERLLYVVPNDDGSVFNVQATSDKIRVADRSWRAGRPFEGASVLTTCECWGPSTTCYRRGEHVAVNFHRPCEGLVHASRRELRRLEGVAIQRLIWSPSGFGDGGFGGQGYGGESYGDSSLDPYDSP